MLYSQSDDYNHPELRWQSFDTEHFTFHYHDGTEETANRAANVAEHVYDTITKLYDYYPEDKIHVLINDYDDFANGYAAYYDNKISLWAPNLDTELRGTHDWIRNVFTHEFSHMIQLQTSKKLGNVPAIYFQFTDYEKEKRKDVVSGFPNVLASYGVPMNIIPGWFAEGVAQNQDPQKHHHDFWDANRDMVLRERILTGNEFSYSKLSDFGDKSSHEAETVYNTGFAYVKYMFDRFGHDITSKISKEMSRPFVFSFEQGIENVTGVEDAESLYVHWIDSLRTDYKDKTDLISKNLVEGDSISDGAFVNSIPRYSPDGKYLAYQSSLKQGEVTFYRRDLYVKDIEKDSIVAKVPMVSFSSYSWTKDSKFIFFSRHKTFSVYGNNFLDIYRYDIENKKEEQLTRGLRATNPAISPDGRSILYVTSVDGNQNIMKLDFGKGAVDEDENGNDIIKDLTGSDDFELLLDNYLITEVTTDTSGVQYYMPAWNNAGDKFVCAKSDEHFGRDIVVFDKDGNVLKNLNNDYDMRNPVFSDDDRYIYYSSDKTGIFNIYRYDLENEINELITNVRGGAFHPTFRNNKIVYVNYKGKKLNIYELRNIKALNPEVSYYKDYALPVFDREYANVNYMKETRKYYAEYPSVLLIPRLTIDKDSFKPGLYVSMNDYLNKINFFGGVVVNTKGDYDLYAMAEYKYLLPALYGEYINVVKHTDNEFDDSLKIIGYNGSGANAEPVFEQLKYEYRYDLKEVSIGLKTPLNVDSKYLNILGVPSIDVGFTIAKYNAEADAGDFVVSYDYYRGKKYKAKLGVSTPARGWDYEINPVDSRDINFTFTRNQTKFMTGFEVDSKMGNLAEKYKDYDFNQYDMSWSEKFGLPFNTGLTFKLKGSYFDVDSIDGFYNDYVGGLLGLKGYSFYSIGGTRTVYGSATYRFPLMLRKNIDMGFMNLKKIYAGVFYEAGNAWTNQDDFDFNETLLSDLKTDIGLSLRFYAISFYGMPTAIEYQVAYGFQKFIDEEVEYGNELRHYFTVLFGFPEF